MKVKVWVLAHWWDGGESCTLHATKKAAEDAIQSYVIDQWNEGLMGDEEFPNTEAEAVNLYFEAFEMDEGYSIRSEGVEFPDLEVPDGEVVLTADECAVVVMALEIEGLAVIAKGCGLAQTEEQADELIQSAYQKLKD